MAETPKKPASGGQDFEDLLASVSSAKPAARPRTIEAPQLSPQQGSYLDKPVPDSFPLPPEPDDPPTNPGERARPRKDLASAEPYVLPTSEPFRGADTSRVMILGGKQTGKSYLFQSMVYRCQSGPAAGALIPWLKGEGMRLFMTTDKAGNGNAQELVQRKFLDYYRRWTRLDQTQASAQTWYKMRLGLQSGFLGLSKHSLDIDFFDASGEILEAPISDFTRPSWEPFREAAVVVFCLPMWTLFPYWRREPTREEGEDREHRLNAFEQLYVNLREIRGPRSRPLRTVLALTMADDKRVALKSIHDRWIRTVIERPEPHLRQLRGRGGVMRYLDNARVVSDVVLRELRDSPWDDLKGIPEKLDFGAGPPWIVPMSAMDGAQLTRVEQKYPDPADRPSHLTPPVPAHVELPLLVGLCDRYNALM